MNKKILSLIFVLIAGLPVFKARAKNTKYDIYDVRQAAVLSGLGAVLAIIGGTVAIWGNKKATKYETSINKITSTLDKLIVLEKKDRENVLKSQKVQKQTLFKKQRLLRQLQKLLSDLSIDNVGYKEAKTVLEKKKKIWEKTTKIACGVAGLGATVFLWKLVDALIKNDSLEPKLKNITTQKPKTIEYYTVEEMGVNTDVSGDPTKKLNWANANIQRHFQEPCFKHNKILLAQNSDIRNKNVELSHQLKDLKNKTRKDLEESECKKISDERYEIEQKYCQLDHDYSKLKKQIKNAANLEELKKQIAEEEKKGNHE